MITFLKYLLLTVEVISSFLLILVILIQRSKGQGLGVGIGGGVGETMFGSQMGNVLTRTTVVLAIIFLVNTTILAVIGGRGYDVSVAESVSVPPPAPVQPVAPAPMASDFGSSEFPAAVAPVDTVAIPAEPADAMAEPVGSSYPAEEVEPVAFPEPVTIPALPAQE